MSKKPKKSDKKRKGHDKPKKHDEAYKHGKPKKHGKAKKKKSAKKNGEGECAQPAVTALTHCNGCKKHCPLTKPKCGTGKKLAKKLGIERG